MFLYHFSLFLDDLSTFLRFILVLRILFFYTLLFLTTFCIRFKLFLYEISPIFSELPIRFSLLNLDFAFFLNLCLSLKGLMIILVFVNLFGIRGLVNFIVIPFFFFFSFIINFLLFFLILYINKKKNFFSYFNFIFFI